MSRAQRVTFYSFKGGVGRTLALLDVAVILARAGRRVVAVDMDLEAPGFHRYPAIRPPSDTQRGISDYVLDRLAGPELALEPYTYRAHLTGVGDRLHIVPAGQRPGELAELIPQLYEPLGDRSLVFKLFAAHVEEALAPDFILFDSRTGLAEIAAVCTVELADAIVALTGLNPQGVDGLADVIERIQRHPARARPAAFLLAYSPIPRFPDFDLTAWSKQVMADASTGTLAVQHPLLTRIAEVHARLWTLAVVEDEETVRKWYPALRPHDRLHWLGYDPWVPVVGEDDFDRPGPLRDDHRRLARAVGLLSGRDLLPDRVTTAAGSPLDLSTRLSDATRLSL